MRLALVLIALLGGLLFVGLNDPFGSSLEASEAAVPEPLAAAPKSTKAKARVLARINAGERHNGVSWVGSRQVTDGEELYQSLVDHGVNWIVQTPFGWQPTYNDPNLHLRTTGGWWGETDQGIRVTTAMAREKGVKTLLKPHIWLRRSEDGKWRSDIAFDSEVKWKQWFDNYRNFIMHYARLAEELEIEGLCIGTELRLTVGRPEWRDIIKEIRSVYSGELTYAGNWYKEYEEVPFWGDLDYIGIQAYFPLATKEGATQAELEEGWRPHLEAIETIAARERMPVVFTEVGYRNTANNAIEPWLWPKRPNYIKQPDGSYKRENTVHPGLDPQAQAVSYQAMFSVFWDKPWFKGLYVWKWFPAWMDGDPREVTHETFSPQHQPALEIIKAQYQGDL